MIARIFDFDQTITIEHTYTEFNISKHKDVCLSYELGKKQAETNIKKGIHALFKHDDKENISAIATWHDNPGFVAGFVSHVLGKELILDKAIKTRMSAINKYHIDGVNKPFYISYVPSLSLLLDTNKNAQITALRNILLEEKLIDETAIINFYDDTENNSKCASELDFVKSYLVERAPEFACKLHETKNTKQYENNHSSLFKFNKLPVENPKTQEVEEKYSKKL